MAFSVKSWVPVAVDVFYGSVKDIKSLGYFIDRFHDRDMGFIMDRGLFSESIIKDMRRMKMHYIVPLRRNSTLVPDNVHLHPSHILNDGFREKAPIHDEPYFMVMKTVDEITKRLDIPY